MGRCQNTSNYRPHSEGMGKVMFSQASIRSHPILDPDGGYPHPRSGRRGGTPSQDLMGVLPLSKTGWGTSPPPLPPRTGWGTPHPLSKTGWGTPPVQDWMGYLPPPPVSKASTCYAAGGVALAFTQEDFLVIKYSSRCLLCHLQLYMCVYMYYVRMFGLLLPPARVENGRVYPHHAYWKVHFPFLLRCAASTRHLVCTAEWVSFEVVWISHLKSWTT